MNRKELIKVHKNLFKKDHEIFILTPSRINIIGEHIDYLGGDVLPANINLYMMGSFSKSKNFSIYSENYKNFGINNFEDKKDFFYDEKNGFLNYFLGCIQILRKHNYKIKGFNVAIFSEIPTSSGLSSSAAFGVSIIKGVLELYNYKVNNIEIALLFKEVENEFMNLKNGIMDQFIIANGLKDNLMLLNTSTLEFSHHKIDLGDYEFVVFNTKKKRNLIDSKYNERVNETKKALEIINQKNKYKNLTEIPYEKLSETLNLIDDLTLKKRVKYVIQEQNRVNKFIENLKNKNYKEMGKILNDGHKDLKNLYEVSCKELNFIVDNSIKIEGVLGARMIGAGFGGCLIIFIHKNSIKKLKNNIIKKYENFFGFSCEMYLVKVVDCAKNIT